MLTDPDFPDFPRFSSTFCVFGRDCGRNIEAFRFGSEAGWNKPQITKAALSLNASNRVEISHESVNVNKSFVVRNKIRHRNRNIDRLNRDFWRQNEFEWSFIYPNSGVIGFSWQSFYSLQFVTLCENLGNPINFPERSSGIQTSNRPRGREFKMNAKRPALLTAGYPWWLSPRAASAAPAASF